ncbi:MAG: DUF2628 domain-containing protein [Pseudomonadota bacterium]
MNTYTVHVPTASGDPEEALVQAEFVREGFSFWALLLPAVWLIVNRMWLVLVAYLAVTLLLEGGAFLIGDVIPGVFAVAVAILFALEAHALKRWSLGRKGFRMVAIIAARSKAEAERRYFDSLSGQAPAATGETDPASGPARQPRARPERPVTGLFQRPGTAR